MEDLYNDNNVKDICNCNPVIEVPVDSDSLSIQKFKDGIEKGLKVITDDEQRAFWSKIIYSYVKDEQEVDQWHNAFHKVLSLTTFPTSLFKKDKVDTALINFKSKEQTHQIARYAEYLAEIKQDIIEAREFRTHLSNFKKMVIAQNKAKA